MKEEWFEVRTSKDGHRSLIALNNWGAYEAIESFSAAAVYITPNYLTIQVSENEHISLSPTYLQFVNHSCQPNAFFDTDAMKLISLVPIAASEEITFFYPSSEWEMGQPFECHCRQSNCLHQIKGAKYLSDDILKQYRLTGFIQRMLSLRSRSIISAVPAGEHIKAT
jgi:hypothetical protein